MSRVPGWFTGEFFGTFLLVFFGCGSVCAAVTTGAQVGVFQVAIVWGLGIAACSAAASTPGASSVPTRRVISCAESASGRRLERRQTFCQF